MITVRSAAPSDIDAIASLLADMDEFYGAQPANGFTDDPTPTIQDALFGRNPAANVLLAWNDAQVVGFAAYSFLWPAAGVARSLYLKELYVPERHRREGVGRLMMAHLGKIAIETGCTRVEWTTDTDNPLAQRFYATLGASPNPTKLFYRIADEDLSRLAAGSASLEQQP